MLVILALLVVTPVQSPPAATPPPPPQVEIRCEDDSVLRVVLLDPTIAVKTKYGELKVPAANVKKIEFANRLTPMVSSQIDAAVANLGHADFASREKATITLRELKAYHAAAEAAKHTNPEIAKRGAEVATFLKRAHPESIALKAEDTVYYDDCKVVGVIVGGQLKVRTAQFGEQDLKLSDMRVLKAGNFRDENGVAAQPAPANMMAFQHQFGKESVYSLTGAAAGTSGIWGTDIYTLDSNLAVAAVHAGVLRPGEAGTVKVRIVASPPQFVASEKNGISSTGYGNYPAGGYEFVR